MDLNAVNEYITRMRERTAKLNEVLNAKADSQYVARVQLEAERIALELKMDANKFATDNVGKAFEDGQQATNDNLKVSPNLRGENVKQVFADNLVATDKNVYVLNAFSELSKSITLASNNVLSLVNGVITGNQQIGMRELRETLLNAMQDEARSTGTPFNVTYANGKKVALETYVNMVARSSMIESANVGSFTRAEALGYDLVKCTEYGSTCPVCSKFEGRVFSISGKSDKYPPLYGTALKKGYSLIHPNCRHEFIPFNEQFYTQDQLKEIQEKSNKPFKDDRTEQEREQYARSQAYNSQLREEFKEYSEMKLQFEDLPYKTIGAYRRAKRQGSETYQDLKNLLATRKE
jgi:hypothetical protein